MLPWIESFTSLAAGRLLWVNVALALAVKVLLPFGGAGLATIAPVAKPFDPAAIVTLTNEARAAAGTTGLVRDAVLDQAAQAKWDDMAARGYFAHVTPDGRQPWDFVRDAGYRYRSAGENLARGFSTEDGVVAAWMNSPSHRANIVNPSYSQIGIAAGRATMDGKETLLVVQLFASPQVAAVAPARATPAPVQASASPRPQAVSTEARIAPVAEAAGVTTEAQRGTEAMSRRLSAWLAGWLALLMAALTLAIAFRGAHRSLALAWAGNAALLVATVVVPAMGLGRGLIF